MINERRAFDNYYPHLEPVRVRARPSSTRPDRRGRAAAAGAGRRSQVDSTYELLQRGRAHAELRATSSSRLKLVWSHTIDAHDLLLGEADPELLLQRQRVQGKEPWEYDGTERDFFFNYRDNVSSDFFVIGGDYPILCAPRDAGLQRARSTSPASSSGTPSRPGSRRPTTTCATIQVDRPYQTSADGEIGTRTRYHYYNPEGAVYLQDRWEHEGMVLNIGLRYDVFSVGRAALRSARCRSAVKKQWSARGSGSPTRSPTGTSSASTTAASTRSRTGSTSSTTGTSSTGASAGNPNLTNETTVSYQAGIQHLFSELVSGQFSVYYKDIFGLLTHGAVAGLGPGRQHRPTG